MRIDGTRPPRRNAPMSILAALNRFSLRSLLIGSTGLFVLFCILVVVYIRVSEGITFRMMDGLINVESVITDLCLKSNASMIDARRLEKDFLLNYREFGFEESRARYISRQLNVLADIKENMARIRQLAGEPATARQTREVESALDRYRRGIDALVEKFAERGYFDSGAHVVMDARMQELETRVETLGDAALLAQLRAVIIDEEEYIEGERDKDALGFAAAYRDFTVALATTRATPAAREAIGRSAERYRQLFEQYVRATEEARTIKRAYLKEVQAVDPLLERLYIDALARVAAKHRAIERSTRLLGLPVIVAGGIVLLLTALLSLFVALTVTRAVVESKTFAERIASGDLDSRLAPGGDNEFTSLAEALNTMAESLREADLARKSGVEALQESEERYRAIVETSADWIWAIDLKGDHTFTNSRVRDILGIEPEELLQRRLPDLIHPDDVARAQDLLRACAGTSSGWQGVVLRWRHRDGSYRWLESSAVVATDASGAAIGIRGTDRDITERRLLEAELIKTQKLEAIGTLAGGIAHDFNNLLQGLFGYLSLAKLSLDQPDVAADLLGQAEKALGLSVNLTTQLLTFAKGGRPVKRRLALATVLEDPVRFALSGSRSDYRLAVDPDLWHVDADEGQIGQVIQNLVLNASESMPQGGTVEIAARNERVPAGANPLVPQGGTFVRIDVRDAGTGIAGEHLARIFDPYFTTKQKGSGLGLATSYSIVRNHDGFIDVASRIGEGSVFSVYLPASADRALPAAPPPAGAGGGQGSVLVMDDDALVRNVAVKMLESLGHAVATAANGEEAIARYRQSLAEGRPFDVVVLDLTVKGGMGGEEALALLRELDPGVKAVVSSGYAADSVVADYRAHGFTACLSKPYRLEALRECLAAVLQSPGRA
jgi:PAS domain S-box-containing protein